MAGGRSGLFGLESILGAVDGVAFVHLTQRDVVRHRIVADIVAAYERADEMERAAGDAVGAARLGDPAGAEGTEPKAGGEASDGG